MVFRTDIDLKGHMAEAHLGSSKLPRSQIKAMKRIDLIHSRSAGPSGSGSAQVLNLNVGGSGSGQVSARISRSSSVIFCL